MGVTTVTCTATDADDGASSPASKTFTVTVAPTGTTTTLGAVPTNPNFGAPVTFTATVAKSSANTATPTGTISFFLDSSGTPVATVNLVGSTASFTTSGLGAGGHTMVATYNGDANFASSTSTPPTAVTVGTTTTITSPHPGALIVAAGTRVLVKNTTVGPVIVQRGGALDVEGSTIASLSTSSATAVRLCASTVKGSVSVNGSTGFVLIGDSGDDACGPNSIGGSLTLQHNTHGVEAIGNHVVGAVTTSGNSGTGAFPEDSASEVSGNGP
jgi:hypothetical protein